MLSKKYKTKKILNIVVNYSNEKEVIEYAKELSKQSYKEKILMVIVINKSTISDLSYLQNELESVDISVEIFNPERNLGYLSGVFFGYRKLVENFVIDVDWIIISNTDIEISDYSFVERFLEKDYPDNVSAVSPSVFQVSTKSFENPHYIERIKKSKIDTLIFIFSNKLLSYIYLNLNHMKSNYKRGKHSESMFIYQGHGCFFILRGSFMNSISSTPYTGFMYSEESYISELLLLENKKWLYDSDFEVKHFESTVTNLLNLGVKAKYYKESLEYIKNKFY